MNRPKEVFVSFNHRPLPRVIADGIELTNEQDVDRVLTQQCPKMWKDYKDGKKINPSEYKNGS